MNDENLTPFTSAQNREEAARNGRAGGVASGRARRIKSRGRKLIQELLALKVKDPAIIRQLCEDYGVNPDDLTTEVAMTLRQAQKAVRKADTNAYNAVLKAAGIADETAPAAPSIGLQINVGTPEAAEGLRHAIETGAQPRDPGATEE